MNDRGRIAATIGVLALALVMPARAEQFSPYRTQASDDGMAVIWSSVSVLQAGVSLEPCDSVRALSTFFRKLGAMERKRLGSARK